MQDYFFSYRPWVSILIVFLVITLYIRIHRFVINRFKQAGVELQRIASVEMMFNLTKYGISILTAIIVLNINGINVTSLATGIGISGIIIAFALQDILKDWINGIAIVWDGYYAVGDVVKFGDVIGKVVDFNLKTTKIRDIVNGNLVTVSNRNVSQVSIVSEWFDIDIPASYGWKLDKIEPVLNEITKRIRAAANVKDCQYIQTSSFEASYIGYRIRITCDPELRYIVQRMALHTVQEVYEANGLDIPFTQIDVHLDKI